MIKTEKSSASTKISNAWSKVMVTAFFALPSMAFADGPTAELANDRVCGFFTNINTLLTTASIAVVTIAVIFAGYQIAFAHKRIADVAPILIGGLLIGAAGQIANMLIGGTDECIAAIDFVRASAAHYA